MEELDPNRFYVPRHPSYMTVTPRIARAWLSRPVEGQRRLSQAIVNKYARYMADGEWPSTHQPVALTPDFRLLDGQHRMAAVDQSKCDVEFFVMPDCPLASFAYIDRPYVRMASHFIPVTIAGAANTLAALASEYGESRYARTYYKGLSNAQLIRVASHFPELELYQPTVDLIKRRRVPAIKINAPVHLAILAQVARTKYADLIPEWLNYLMEGVFTDFSDPRYLLVKRFGAQTTYLNSTNHRDEAYILCVKAMNCFISGERKSLTTAGRIPAILGTY